MAPRRSAVSIQRATLWFCTARERLEAKIEIWELTKDLDHTHSQHRNLTTVPLVRSGKFAFILRNNARVSHLWILYAYPYVFGFEVLCTGEGLWWTPGAQYTSPCVLMRVTLFAGVQCTKCNHVHVKSDCFTPEESSLYYGNKETSLVDVRCWVLDEWFTSVQSSFKTAFPYIKSKC
jgi:hypothetical protein